MPSPKLPLRLALVALGCCIVPILPSCRKTGGSPAEARSKPVPAVLLVNNFPGNPSSLLADQANAPVHWQKWEKATLTNAQQAERLIFAVIALPQQPESRSVLKSIYSDPELVHDINSNFVPTLVDADTYRETAILAESLCREIRQPFSLPLFVWLTPDGNPVAWIPAQAKKSDIRDLFNQSSNMVSRMWTENPGYVVSNSLLDNKVRAERLASAAKSQPPADDVAGATFRGIRQLASLYDPGSRTFDNSGGLFPASTMELLTASALMREVPRDSANIVREAASGLIRDLSSSAMIDPLDGGIFSARRGSAWQLPRFTRDCSNQARAIVALVGNYRLSRNPVVLDQILKSIGYAEKHYATADGLFSLGRQSTAPLDHWMWTMEELENGLSPDELKVWTAVSNLRNLGNLPMESDPNREYFRKNTLSLQTTPEAAAGALGISPETARAHFESGRLKLLKLRDARPDGEQPDPHPHAVASFRMASAYAAAYTATGDVAFKDKAAATWKSAREAFSRGPTLLLFPGSTDPMNNGRAFLYAVAMGTCLDVFDITLDPAIRAWAEDLASTASERFMDGDQLRENTPDQSLINVTVSDRVMISDDSSAGLLSAAQARLAKLGYEAAPAFGTAVLPLTADAFERPLLHTDALLASLIRLNGPSISISGTASEELKTTVSRLPLRLISRRTALPAETVSPGSAKITFANGTIVSVNTPAELESAIFAGGRRQ